LIFSLGKQSILSPFDILHKTLNIDNIETALVAVFSKQTKQKIQTRFQAICLTGLNAKHYRLAFIFLILYITGAFYSNFVQLCHRLQNHFSASVKHGSCTR